MATQEARRAAIEKAARLVRGDRTGFLSRRRPLDAHPKAPTNLWLKAVYDLSAASGNPEQDFFYLGGKMTDVPKFNFPEFDRVAAILRDQGYNIVSPAELDSPSDRVAALASEDGDHGGPINGKSWEDFLARDAVIVAMPRCIGGIFMEGWTDSEGAKVETFILDRLKKPTYLFTEDDGPTLTRFDRDQVLATETGAAYARNFFAGSDPLAREAGHLEQRPNPLDLDPLGAQRRVRSI